MHAIDELTHKSLEWTCEGWEEKKTQGGRQEGYRMGKAIHVAHRHMAPSHKKEVNGLSGLHGCMKDQCEGCTRMQEGCMRGRNPLSWQGMHTKGTHDLMHVLMVISHDAHTHDLIHQVI